MEGPRSCRTCVRLCCHKGLHSVECGCSQKCKWNMVSAADRNVQMAVLRFLFLVIQTHLGTAVKGLCRWNYSPLLILKY